MKDEAADLLAAARTTVDTFSSIVGRQLTLKNGRTARTDGSEVVVPFKDEDPYLLVERQLAHVLFRSDARAREKFVQEFIQRTVQAAYKQSLPQRDYAEMQPTLERVVDILESRRIESLWALLYPGSHTRSRERLRNETSGLIIGANDSLFNLMVCIDAGHLIPAGRLDEFRPHLEEALQKVERRGFDATLTIARWLISRLVNQAAQSASEEEEGRAGSNAQEKPAAHKPVKERMEALRDVSALFGELPKELEQRYSDYLTGEDNLDSEEALKHAFQLDLRIEDDVDASLDRSGEMMGAFLQQVQGRLQQDRSRDDWLRDHANCDVAFIDIKPNDVAMHPLPILDEDREAVLRLRQLFARVMARRETRREDSGGEVDVGAYIERRLTGQPIPCFRVPQRSRGFRITILVDRSLSMKGKRTRQAERAVRMLLDALDFPFVEVAVWGFQAFDGEVVITRFNPDLPSLDTERSLPVQGETPLHVALRAAVRDLGEGSEVRHLVVLTDGGPYFVGKNGKEVPERDLRQEVREHVRRARRSGINVTALLIGKRDKKGELVFEVTPKHVEYMFGHQRHWKYVDDENFSADLVQAVTQSFVAYLNDS